MDAVPTQEKADLSNPREHLAWTFPGIKLSDGGVLMMDPDTLENWSAHQVKCGVVHVDFIRRLANAEGYIHVDQLPKQQIERHPPRRGADHYLNPTGKWVPMGTPRDPEITAPDVTEFTPGEAADVLEQMIRNGTIPAAAAEELVAKNVVRPERLLPDAFRMPDPVIDVSALKNRKSK